MYLFKVFACRLYKPYVIFSFGGEALSRAEPPAGPPKVDLLCAGGTFPKISLILRLHARTFLPLDLGAHVT